MLILFYNILQLTVLVFGWPVLLALILLTPKYRRRMPYRLGWRLARRLPPPQSGQHTFWVHALSVGEVTSAIPLITGLRKEWPQSRIIVTASTETGEQVAREHLTGLADHVLSSPLDLIPVITLFLRRIRPDVFVLVETDFWPNQLAMLQQAGVPCLLVNGRISQKSLDAYRKFSIFFAPMFARFRHLCMQTRADAENMESLGVESSRLQTLGNLKFDTQIPSAENASELDDLFPQNRQIFVAGSTHDGEEQLILDAYTRLQQIHPELFLIIVPRNPKRAARIRELAANLSLTATQRTQPPSAEADVLIVDTIGELVQFYSFADIAFVGGSLVPEGGHNPIEPAAQAVPVLFGPFMDDFTEIAADLVEAGGALQVIDSHTLETALGKLATDTSMRRAMGDAALSCIEERQGVIRRHLDLIQTLL